jgi:hypothetical protein
MSTSLLTQEDLNYIDVRGVPFPPRAALTIIGSAGDVTFTVRGIQFYKKALASYGLSSPLSELKSEADLYNLSDVILQIKKKGTSAALHSALLRGQIEQQQKSSVTQRLYSNLRGWFRADAQQEMCVEAGSNVIPVHFFKKNVAPLK